MKWISVKDRLPEKGERVLTTDGKIVFEAYLKDSKQWYRHGINMDFINFEVTHWMPLPEPPKGE